MKHVMMATIIPPMDVLTHVLLNQGIIEAMNHHSVVQYDKTVSKLLMKNVTMGMVSIMMVALHNVQ